MKKIVVLVLLTSISVTTYAQKVILPIKDFTGIDVFGPFDVELIKSDSNRVELDYNGADKENLVTEIQRGVLKMKLKSKHYWSDWNNHEYKKATYVIVKVYYSDIDEIIAQAGAIVKTRERLKSKYLSIDCAMGAEVTLDLLCKDMLVKSSMGSILKLNGQTESMDAKVTMGGVLKASTLESKIVFVKASMGGDVTVNVLEELDVSSSFGSNVNYIGRPAMVNTSKNMGGEVHKKKDN
jgi:hypothetical protein